MTRRRYLSATDQTNEEKSNLTRSELKYSRQKGKAKYMGQRNTFMDQGSIEIQHRIRRAWAAFAKHGQELTSRSYLLRHRFRFSESVVTPSMMYGVGTWATTKEHERLIRTTQRRMLRLIIQTERRYRSKKVEQEVIQDEERSMYTTNSVAPPLKATPSATQTKKKKIGLSLS